ncbi:MAG: efflux RND transporter periplasmic adaptor subunit [Luteitalea sp.]|nr:efflux RND transporter periplasmic adaptor subunit [Luteitalea sp.]
MTRARMTAVFGCLGLLACGRAAESPAPQPATQSEAPASSEGPAGASEIRVEEGMLRDLRITTARVESRRGDEQVMLLGELAVDERTYAEVGVPVSARVIRLLAGLGDNVADGQALLELQSTEVGRARSDYLTSMAHLTLAESALERKRELAAERIAPQREVQEAEATATAAREDVRAASATLSSMGLPAPDGSEAGNLRSSMFTLRSPVRGTVIERRAVRGQLLDPSNAAFRVADLSTLWLTVHAFERDAVRIQQGTTARLTFSALPGQEFAGDVTVVGRQVSSESRTVDVRIDVRNRGSLLRPGMSASAALPIGIGNTPILAVPVAAVQRVGESWCVFVTGSTGRFEIRKIGRGRDLGMEVEVLSGVSAGETIVVDGAFLLKAQAEKRDAGHGDH